jgi:hypothetical protein
MHAQYKLLAAVTAVAMAMPALAGITAEEAKALGGTLTGVGAEKAANKDGTIPAYTGGLTTPPAGFKPGDGIRTPMRARSRASRSTPRTWRSSPAT